MYIYQKENVTVLSFSYCYITGTLTYKNEREVGIHKPFTIRKMWTSARNGGSVVLTSHC